MVRATPLPPDERRAALMAATEPLLEQFGRDVSTRQIAEAAGVAEGTIFRAFATKEALIDACVAEAFDVSHTIDELAAVEETADLAACVLAAVAVLQGRMRRVIALFHTLRLPPTSAAEISDFRARQASDNERLNAGLVELLRPFHSELRRPLEQSATALRAVTFALTHPMLGAGEVSTPEQISDLLLHGLAVPISGSTPEDASC